MSKYYYEPIQADLLCQHKKAKGYQSFPYHRHNGYEIYFFIQGNILLYLEQACFQLTPGDIALIPPTSMHRIVSLDDQYYERITINLKHSVFERLSTPKTDLSSCFYSDRQKNGSILHISEQEKPLFIQYAEDLSHYLKLEEYGADVMVDIISRQLLLWINQHTLSTAFHESIMPSLVKNVMIYIRKNVTEELTLERLSKEFYHNGSYISRLFKKHIGLSLREYILDQRIESAKELLIKGSNVSEACYGSGFSDYSNFIRSFTKVVGISPGKYKKQNREQ